MKKNVGMERRGTGIQLVGFNAQRVTTGWLLEEGVNGFFLW